MHKNLSLWRDHSAVRFLFFLFLFSVTSVTYKFNRHITLHWHKLLLRHNLNDLVLVSVSWSSFSAFVLVWSRRMHVLSPMTVSPHTFPTRLKENKSEQCTSSFPFAHTMRHWPNQTSDRRQELFDKIIQSEENKLHDLLPARNTSNLNLKNKRKFKPMFKTKRFHNSFITFKALKA